MLSVSKPLGLTLAGAQIAYGLDAPRPPWMTRAIVALYLTTSTVDAIEQRGPRGAAVVAAAGSIGFGAELLGVHTGRPFGPYDYSGQLGPKVAGVPLMAAAAWALLARPSRVVGQLAAGAPGRAAGLTGLRGRLATVGAAAAALTAWDVFLDPRMVREGYWRWPGGGRYEGIPATNYLGWLATSAVIFAAAELIDPSDDPLAPVGPSAERSGDMALGIYLWTWIGEVIANVLLWRRPRIAVAGGVSMGLVSIPAVLARVRAARGR